MQSVQQLREYVERHRDLAFEVIRIYLGLGLFAKGIYFVSHPASVTELLQNSSSQVQFLNIAIIGHYVGLAHVCGGLLLAVGLVTRLAAAVQIPVLLAAVFLVHIRQGFLGADQNLDFALLVLFLLGTMVVHGGGRWSADYYLARESTFTAPPSNTTTPASGHV
jgi:uncharacterized membrane protein YphA (DoxX/SURF4 family)